MTTNLLAVQLKHFHAMDPATIYTETKGSADYVKPLYSGGTRVQNQHVPFCVAYDFQDMGMATDEDIRLVAVYEFARPDIISTGVTTDVGHKDPHAFTLIKTMQRMVITESVIIAVSRHSHQRLERSDFSCQIKSSTEIPGMPYLVNRL